MRSSTRTRPDKLLHNIQLSSRSAAAQCVSLHAASQRNRAARAGRSEQSWSVARLRKRELCTARVPHCGTVRAAH